MHKLYSGIFAITFLFLVRLSGGIFRYLFLGFALYAILLLAYNARYLRQQNHYTFWSWIRPLISFASVATVYLVIPSELFLLRGLFLIFSALFIYFSMTTAAASAEQVIYIDTLLSYFGISVGLFAEHFYFPTHSYIVLAGIGISTFVISRSSLDHIPQPDRKKDFYSLVLALAILELAWTFLFLPLHFTALAIFLFNCFYVLWIITYYYLFNNLSRKKIVFHVLFSCVLIIVTLLSTPWK